jgi:hypothetical protein
LLKKVPTLRYLETEVMNEGRNICFRVQGRLPECWRDWFDGLEMGTRPNGETTLTGLVADQPALFGILNQIRNLGLPLIAVEPVPPAQAEE